MSLITDLMELTGVVAAGDFVYRGDQYSAHRGPMSEEETRTMSSLCRANTTSMRMEGDLLALFSRVCQPEAGGCGFDPAKGWVMHGAKRSICVISNVYCLIDNDRASLTEVLGLMRERLSEAPDHLM